HAADRAGARSLLPNLRVHRAGVDRAFDRRLGRTGPKILLRIRGELRAAAGGAEIIGFAFVRMFMRRGRGIDRHAADGVDGVRMGMAAVIVRMLVMDAHVRPLAVDTLGGYLDLMPKHSKTAKKESTLKRLSRIEGQVRGL